MFGQYKEDLGQFARSEALRLKNLEKLRKTEERLSNKDLKPYTSECQRKCFSKYRQQLLQKKFAHFYTQVLHWESVADI